MRKKSILHVKFSPWPVGLFFCNGLENMDFIAIEQPHTCNCTAPQLWGCSIAGNIFCLSAVGLLFT